jgi:hypothetical protein
MAKRNTQLLVAALVSASSFAACSAPPPAPHPPPSASVAGTPSPAPAAVDAGLTSAALDDALGEAWKKAGITPAPLADDATFLRRVSLDLHGVIPTEEEVNAFLADTSPQKRAVLIDKLLAHPRATEALVDYWESILLPPAPKERRVSRPDFRAFLRERFAKNVGWNQIAEELIGATGQNGGAPEDGQKINGAVSYLLKFGNQTADLAGTVSKTFLGVQIQCAQCHDHKTEAWKQSDFQKFAACFQEVKIDGIDKGGGGLQRAAIVNKDKLPPRVLKQTPPTALDGTAITPDTDGSRRTALAKWMTRPDNPYFAKVFVNRTWAHFFGRGFVNPVDDIRPSNPADLPELLDLLARDFVAHGYDIRRLQRQLAGMRAYQLDGKATPDATGKSPEIKLWSRYRLSPMGPDVLLDSTVRALGIEAVVEKTEGQSESELRQGLRDKLAFVFDVDEEDDPPDFEGTLSQSLFLLNGRLVNAVSMDLPGAALDKLLAEEPDDEKLVKRLFVRVLGRPATAPELAPLLAHVKGESPTEQRAADAKAEARRAAKKKNKKPKKAGKDPYSHLAGTPSSDPRRRAFEDVLVALVNSSEFFFNH